MTIADWSVLELPGLMASVRSAARSVGSLSTTVLSSEDLEQEGFLWCAENATEVRKLHGRDDQLLKLRLYSRLYNKARVEMQRNERVIGLHRLYENE